MWHDGKEARSMTAAWEYQVWWVPQIPMKAFIFPVGTIEAGHTLCDALAKYDAFQLENRVKPDYCNAGGVQMRHPVGTEGEWWDVPDDPDELADILAECEKRNVVA